MASVTARGVRGPSQVSVQGGSGCDAEDIEDAKARQEAMG